MAEVKKLIEGYRRFYKSFFVNDKKVFTDLSQGQSPRTLIIACSDSRVDPSILFNAGPGDIFVIRNVANLVPPFQPDSAYHGTSAALEFAVTQLGVRHIVVMGHSGCAGIRTLLDSETSTASAFIHNWVNIAAEAKRATIEKCSDHDQAQTCCEQEGILVSLRNLKTFPWIADKVAEGSLRLHGWHFSIEDGTLAAFDEGSGSFNAIPVDG